jgi:uncharacterized membrane protein
MRRRQALGKPLTVVKSGEMLLTENRKIFIILRIFILTFCIANAILSYMANRKDKNTCYHFIFASNNAVALKIAKYIIGKD